MQNTHARSFIRPNQARKEKIFLIAIANSNDPHIGHSSKTDLEKVVYTFNTIAENLGIMNPITREISGEDFNKDAVVKALEELNPAPIDIVLFYYSGHGFRYLEDESKFTRMSFRTSERQDLSSNNLSLEFVYHELLKKGPRVTIVMGDCCNAVVETRPSVGRPADRTRGEIPGPIRADIAQKLFFPEERLSILCGAADVNQFSSGNPAMGGFFTHFFIEEINKHLYGDVKTPATWENILNVVKEKARYQALTAACKDDNRCRTGCAEVRCRQTAIFRILPSA